MKTGTSSIAFLILTTVIPCASCFAHTPVEFLEAVSVVPARSVEHAVELQGMFDDVQIETMLVGPKMFSRAVGCLERPVKKPLAYLNWFKIVDPSAQPVREVGVMDMVRGSQSKMLRIQSAEYLLSPSQLITTGSPDPIPVGLDHYKAYRVVDAASLDRQIEVTDSAGTNTRRLGKPLFVCLPTEEWHHDEHFPVSHPSDCLVVYELDELGHTESVSVIDQFGLNELRTKQSKWLCVRAVLLRNTVE